MAAAVPAVAPDLGHLPAGHPDRSLGGGRLNGALDRRQVYRACHLLLVVTALKRLWDSASGHCARYLDHPCDHGCRRIYEKLAPGARNSRPDLAMAGIRSTLR